MTQRENQNKGTYAGVHFSDTTNKKLAAYCQHNRIPNAIPIEQFHTTILFSRKHLPDYVPLGKCTTPIQCTPTGFTIWTSNTGDGPITNCLILLYDCPYLIERHNQLMQSHDATYDYDKYIPHVTLSYNIGDNFDISKLSDIKQDIPVLIIDHEYGHDLNLNWALQHK